MPSGDLSLHHEASISQHMVYAEPSSFKLSSQPEGGQYITLEKRLFSQRENGDGC